MGQLTSMWLRPSIKTTERASIRERLRQKFRDVQLMLSEVAVEKSLQLGATLGNLFAALRGLLLVANGEFVKVKAAVMLRDCHETTASSTHY